MTNKDDVRAVIKWIKKSADPRYLKRLEDGSVFPVDDRSVSFAEGLNVFKWGVSKDLYNDDVMNTDLSNLEKTPLSNERYEALLKRLDTNAVNISLVRLYAALIEAQCGFTSLGEKEYKALQASNLTPRFKKNSDFKAQEIWRAKPIELKDIEYTEFKDLVATAMQELAKERETPLNVEVARSDTDATSMALLSGERESKPVAEDLIQPIGKPAAEMSDELEGDEVLLTSARRRLTQAPMVAPTAEELFGRSPPGKRVRYVRQDPVQPKLKSDTQEADHDANPFTRIKELHALADKAEAEALKALEQVAEHKKEANKYRQLALAASDQISFGPAL